MPRHRVPGRAFAPGQQAEQLAPTRCQFPGRPHGVAAADSLLLLGVFRGGFGVTAADGVDPLVDIHPIPRAEHPVAADALTTAARSAIHVVQAGIDGVEMARQFLRGVDAGAGIDAPASRRHRLATRLRQWIGAECELRT